ncbi:hypothetical protein GT3570_06940 [Geobacillus thermoleovorans]|nr:hypothetical protein GT3570_06940 [Geobacillus thermoleovorans]
MLGIFLFVVTFSIRKGLTMGGAPNGLEQFYSQGRTTIKKNVLLSVCVHHSLWEGGADFHAWVERKFFSWMFYLKNISPIPYKNMI